MSDAFDPEAQRRMTNAQIAEASRLEREIAYLRQALETARALADVRREERFGRLYAAALTGILASDRGFANVVHPPDGEYESGHVVTAGNAFLIATAALERWERGT